MAGLPRHVNFSNAHAEHDNSTRGVSSQTTV